MRSYKTEAIIIKRRNFNEADRIITILTRDLGKLQVKAQGVRKITSRRSSHIELLNHSELSLYKGSSMSVLVEAQMLEAYSDIKSDFEKVGFAYHVCELIDGLCPEGQEYRDVFFLLKKTLARISKEQDMLLLVHDFEIELLTILGFWHKPAEDSRTLNTQDFIENILERRLKSQKMFARLHE
jgi:DNA repair protein RecO (recombination protein O)